MKVPPAQQHETMSPSLLSPTLRDPGKGKRDDGKRPRFNPPRVFRVNFTGFHIMFSTVDIRKPGQLIAALAVISIFSLLATVLYFMMQRYEHRAVMYRRKRWAAAPMFALRLLFVYALILLVQIMNIWVIFAVTIGHICGWLVYFLYIKDCLGDPENRRGGEGNDGGDGGDDKNQQFEDSSVSSRSSDGNRPFWDLA